MRWRGIRITLIIDLAAYMERCFVDQSRGGVSSIKLGSLLWDAQLCDKQCMYG